MSWKNAAEGAVYGVIFTSVLGQIPPFTALPEEVATIPAGAIIGALLGAKKIKKVLKI